MNVASRPAGPSRRAKRPGAGESEAVGARLAAALRHPAPWSALLALLLYLQAIRCGWVRDDHSLVEQNTFLHRDGWLSHLLTSDYWASGGGSSGLWRPLVLFSYWIDGRLSGWNPAWFHGVNLALHAAVSALVAGLAKAASGSSLAGFAAGLWFAAMPAHVESVGWVAGRTDLMCALFFLAALALDRRARREGRRWPGVFALAALAAALASKEAALPFVAVVAVAEWLEPRPVRERLIWLAPYLALTLAYVGLHERWSDAVRLPAGIDAALAERRRWAGWTMLPGYVAFLWPWFPHSPEIEIALPASPWAPAVVGGALLNAALAAALALAIRRRSRGAALAIAVAWFPLVPAIALTLARGRVLYAERLVYLPSAAAAAGLAFALVTAPPRLKPAALGLAAALVLASAWMTVRLVPDWRNDATMYRAMVRAQPANAKARVGFAETLLGEGHEDAARAQLARAEALDPRLPEVQVGQAVFHARRAEWDSALFRSRAALALDPGRFDAGLIEANALFRLGDLEGARQRLEGVLAVHRAEPTTEAMLGEVLLAGRDPTGAIPHLEQAVRWNRGDPALWFALGNADLAARRLEAARVAFENVVRLKPDGYDAWLRLAAACHAMGDGVARDAALARAAALPAAADGRAAAMRRDLAGPR